MVSELGLMLNAEVRLMTELVLLVGVLMLRLGDACHEESVGKMAEGEGNPDVSAKDAVAVLMFAAVLAKTLCT